MKKLMLSILCLLCFFACGVCVIQSSSNALEQTNLSQISPDVENGNNACGYSLHSSFEKFTYDTDELINVSFILESECNVSSISYQIEGFSIVSAPVLTTSKTIDAQILYDNTTATPMFTVYAELLNEGHLSAHIYGTVEEGKLYVNGSSFTAARDIYYAEKIRNKTMTQKQYEAALRSDSVMEMEEISSNSIGTNASSDASIQTFIAGTLKWQDDAGVNHPLQYTKVSICQSSSDNVLGTVYTNVNGRFSFSYLEDGYGRNIYIRVCPEGENSIVKTGTGNDYVWTSPSQFVEAGSLTNIKKIFVMDAEIDVGIGRAMQISQAVIAASRYVKAMHGSNISPVTVKYPHIETNSGCFYREKEKTIYITGDESNNNPLKSYASWDVIMHEYGHHVQSFLGNISDNPGDSHWVAQNMADHYSGIGHESGDGCNRPSSSNEYKDYGIRIAWAEAWPTVFGAMAQQYYKNELMNIATVGDARYDSYNNAKIDFIWTDALKGDACESSVAGALWCIYTDTGADYDNLPGIGHRAMWDLITGNSLIHSFSDFAKYFYKAYPQFTSEFGEIMGHFEIAPSNLKITNTYSLTVPPTFSWDGNGGSKKYPNNEFCLVFYDVTGNIVRKFWPKISTFLYTLEVSDWQSIYGKAVSVNVIAWQTSNPTTGEYISQSLPIYYQQFKYTFINRGYEISAQPGSLFTGTVEIPSSYNNQPVIRIADYGFMHNENGTCTNGITSIIIPETVITIGHYAFSGVMCSEIDIPISVSYIAPDAFHGCVKLSKITQTSETKFSSGGLSTSFTEWETVEWLPTINFVELYDSGRRTLSIKYSMNFEVSGTIEYELRLVDNKTDPTIFSDNKFTPDSGENHTRNLTVDSIAIESLLNNPQLLVQIRYRKTKWLGTGHFTFTGQGTIMNFELNDSTQISNGLVIINNEITAFYEPANFNGTVKIPNSVTSIGDGAFSYCENLEKVIFEYRAQLVSIGNNAFLGCTSLKDISLPSSLTVIGECAFMYCSSLTRIYIPWNVTSINYWAFYECNSLSTIYFDAISCSDLNDSIFQDYDNVSIIIGKEVTKIPGNLFYSMQIRNIVIPVSVTYIGQSAFRNISSPVYYGGEKLTQWNNIDIRTGNKFDGIIISCYSNTQPQIEGLFWHYVEDIPKPWPFSISYRDVGDKAFSGTYGTGHKTLHIYGMETELVDPTRLGYTFDGWYKNSSGTGSATTTLSATGYLSDITLYAKWTPKTYNITYKDVEDEAFSGTHGSGYPTVHIYGTPTDLVNPTKEGCIFDGWYTSSSGTGSAITVLSALDHTDNITLYAKWTPKTYSIAYKDVGDEAFSGTHGSGYPTVHTYGTPTDLVNPTKKGYTFDGWYANSRGTGSSQTAISAMYSSDITLYAKWTPKTYTIAYKDVGDEAFSGTHGSGYPTVHTYGMPTDLVNPTKEGYFFDGWYTSSSGTGSAITVLSALDYTDNITLYAKWSEGTPGLAYTLINNGSAYEVAKGTANTNGEVTIPKSYNGLPVTRIQDSAFCNCTGLTTVNIPSSVEAIGYEAFEYCKNLANVFFDTNSALTLIDAWAFNGCKLTNITLPNSLTTIERYAFYNSKLTSIVIPSSVTLIKDDVFSSCENLLSVEFASNSSLIDIGSYAFSHCKKLSSISIPSSVNSIGSSAFRYCENLLSVTFASSSSLTNIGAYAFSNCSSLTSIQIPASVTDIGNNAFAYCNELNTVSVATNNEIYKSEGNCVIRKSDNALIFGCKNSTIPTYATSIGCDAFRDISALTSITIPNSVTSIDRYAFSGCSGLTNINIPSSVTTIGNNAFSGCTGLTSIAIANGVETLGDYAFENCSSITTITLPESLTDIGYYTFIGCYSLTAINVDTSNNNYSSIDGVVYNKARTTLICYPCGKTGVITMATGISEIGNYAFSGCNMTSIVIPASITTINYGAFSGCYELATVTFEAGSLLTEIGENAFDGCCSLLSIIIPARVRSLGNSLFIGCESLYLVKFEENSSLETIGSSVFDSCYNLVVVTIPTGVESIQYNAFNYCTGIEEITIPSTVTYMESNVFDGWTSEQTIYIDADYSILDDWDSNWAGYCDAQIAWLSSTGYTGDLDYYLIQDDNGNYGYEVSVGNSLDGGNGVVIIPDMYQGFPVIGVADYGFNNCTELTKVVFVSGALVSIGKYAFSGCYNLVNINIPTTVTKIGGYAFYECHSLRNINIPASVTEIGHFSFAGCLSLRSITMPSAVILIDYNALDGTYGYTIYAEADYEPSNWYFLQNTSDVSIFWGCTFASGKSYVVSIIISDDNYINTDPLYPPYREGYIFAGWSTTVNGLPQYTMQDIRDGCIPTETILYAVWIPR